ncbi:Ribosomal subunit 39S [Popillia japonica]|uniref:Large ribosomal subunit protein mL50 n=1 Tax=Popillia japonica TaxID=7064 RepID=A0AAW1JZE7_POPJA
MAALVRHGVLKTGQVKLPQNGNYKVLVCSFATKAEKKKGIDRKVAPKIDSSAQSLAAKGFLRPQKDYTPPEDVSSRLRAIIQNNLGIVEKTTKLTDLTSRFAIFTACKDEFNHGIPNSLLHTVETVEDLCKFYETPVSATVPLDKLRTMDLPKNLHIQYEYHRFHPDTDTKFGGITAFPRSSTLVTGLKYKGKYKGHTQATTWPYHDYK